MIGWLLVAVLGSSDPSAEMIERARALTSVGARCDAGARAGEVVVCARRRGDAYRLPLVERAAGTRADPTPDQRLAAIRPESNCAAKSAFLVGCGSVGVGAHFGSDGSRRLTTAARERTPDIAR